MKANVQTVQEQLNGNDKVLDSIRCSLEVFIYRQVVRPGILATTENKLIFCADSIEGNEVNEIYEYQHIKDISLKKGLMNKYITMNYKSDVVKFKHIMSDNVEQFIGEIKRGSLK